MARLSHPSRPLLFSTAFILSVCCARASFAQHPVFDSKGYQEGRDYFGQLPFENIDTLTGNLMLTFTDLVLPGNAGLDTRFQRTFNSKRGGQWSFGLAGIPMRIEKADPMPPWWDDHPLPIIVAADGGQHETVALEQFDGTFNVTREFWKYNRVSNQLMLPNGLVCEFGLLDDRESDPIYAPKGHNVRYLTVVRDLFGNRLELSYVAGNTAMLVTQIHQDLGVSQVRDVTLEYESDFLQELRFVRFIGRTWEYRYTPGSSGQPLLSEAIPPVGPRWQYGYTSDALTSVTTPNGGQISFTYGSHVFGFPTHTGKQGNLVVGGTSVSRVVTDRTVGGRGLDAGTWHYDYSEVTDSDKKTIITGPTKTVTVHYGFSAPEWSVDWRTVSQGASVLEREDLIYQAIAYDNWSSWATAPFLKHRTVQRGSRTWQTENSYSAANYGDFGRPFATHESGELVRDTLRTFEYDFGSNYVKNRTREESVTVGGETFTRHFNYNRDTAFLEGETIYGISTNYQPDAHGNRASARDAHLHTTSYTYEWGTLKDTITPRYTIARSINQDGTVAWETRRGFTTNFGYDILGRLTSTQPARGFATAIEYASDGSWIRVTRGLGPAPSQTTISLDGFGRKVATSNTVGVTTTTEYDVDGRRKHESYPHYGTTNTGISFQFDELDRVTRATNDADGTFVRYDYSNGIDVTITDENGHATSQDWSAFGDPADARLVGVTDAEQGTFTYEYNGLGRLTRVNQPGMPARQWTYWPGQDLLKQDIQPESGTTSYVYDPAGLLITKDDANGSHFAFGYDANHRLTSIDAPGTADDVTMDYDASDNRTVLTNGAVASTFEYDEVNRLTLRRDTIGSHVFETRYTYDDWDNLKHIGSPSGHSADYDYDRENRVIRVMRDPNATIVAEVTSYHASGAVERLAYHNGIVEQFDQDSRQRLRHVSGGPLDLTYDYDTVGNVRRITDTRPGYTQDFSYDGVDRLTGVSGFGSRSFTYDAVGNRRTKTTTAGTVAYGYNGVTGRLDSASGGYEDNTYGYNPSGDQTASSGVTIEYTPFHMMRSFQTASGTTTYAYDGDNQRMRKTATGETEYTIRGPAAQPISEWVENAAGFRWVRDYVYLGSRLLASISAPAQSVTIRIVSPAPTVSESGGSVTVQVQMTTGDGQPLQSAARVSYATANGSATAGSDYTAVSGTLQFATATPSGATQTIAIPVLQDNPGLYESAETFTLNLSAPSGATLGSPSAVTVTITDDDPFGPIIDRPGPQEELTVFGPFTISGWAIDPFWTGAGTGVEAVAVYLYPNGASPPRGPESAIYGDSRPDVGQAYGTKFTNSGYHLRVGGPDTANGLRPGHYLLDVFSYRTASHAWDAQNVRWFWSTDLAIDAPAADATVDWTFPVTGWAVDPSALGHPSCPPGVCNMRIRALDATTGGVLQTGTVTYGATARPDVADLFGSPAAKYSSYSTMFTLTPGRVRLEVSSVDPGGATIETSTRVLTVAQTDPRAFIDAPTNEQAVTQPFDIRGWAVDLGAPTGTGVDAVAFYAFLNGDTSASTFLGWRTTPAFTPRPDVVAFYQIDPRYTNCGFQLSVSGLAPGHYLIGAYVHSMVTNAYSYVRTFWVTVQ